MEMRHFYLGGIKMATITKRGDTYRIRTSCGYDVHGKQVIKSMTYKPQSGMSGKQIEKEVNRQAVLFEEQCKQGQTVTSAKFETFACEWFKDYAEIKLKRTTVCNYHKMRKRIYPALGHIRIDKITPLDIQRFVSTLAADGLTTDYIKSHVLMVSNILSYAVRKRILTYNPCSTVDYPKAQDKKRDFYTVEEVKELLGILRNEDEENKPFAIFFTLAIYTGCRKGELLGLEWKDMDFDDNTISIARAYYYDNYKHEYYTDTPKTKGSIRSLKLPAHVMETLKEYRMWQDKQRAICGSSWVENDRLFTKWDGEMMYINAPTNYFIKLSKRTGIRHVTTHSFQHFNASALINSGVDVVTVQKALGHNRATTTLGTYSHAFSNAQAKAMEAIANTLDL